MPVVPAVFLRDGKLGGSESHKAGFVFQMHNDHGFINDDPRHAVGRSVREQLLFRPAAFRSSVDRKGFVFQQAVRCGSVLRRDGVQQRIHRAGRTEIRLYFIDVSIAGDRDLRTARIRDNIRILHPRHRRAGIVVHFRSISEDGLGLDLPSGFLEDDSSDAVKVVRQGGLFAGRFGLPDVQRHLVEILGRVVPAVSLRGGMRIAVTARRVVIAGKNRERQK